MAGSLPADLFNEVGDAGGLLGNAAVTSGAGALTQIMGTLGLGDADLYAIHVDGGGTFSATTVGGVAPGFDTQLFLLDSTGHGVYFNDDFSGFDAPSTLPAGHALTPIAPGLYYLGITAWNLRPASAGGEIFPPGDLNHNDILGPVGAGGALPLTGYVGAAGTAGPYTISLTGAGFAVPEPSSILLLATVIGLVAARCRRRIRP
jgi:hypothetical protein